MAATKVNLNWSSVTFASVAITRITSVQFGKGGQLLNFSGDGDVYPTVIAAVMSEPHATVTSADLYGMSNGLAVGAAGSLVATTSDAKAQSGGNVTFTLANAVVENVDAGGQHAQFGVATATFKAFSTDGSTNPLTFTEA